MCMLAHKKIKYERREKKNLRYTIFCIVQCMFVRVSLSLSLSMYGMYRTYSYDELLNNTPYTPTHSSMCLRCSQAIRLGKRPTTDAIMIQYNNINYYQYDIIAWLRERRVKKKTHLATVTQYGVFILYFFLDLSSNRSIVWARKSGDRPTAHVYSMGRLQRTRS